MRDLNYALAKGNKTLLQVQAEDKTLAMQLWYSGLTSTDTSIEVWVSTSLDGPYAKIEAATKALIPEENTSVITLSGTSFLHIQFRLVTSNGSNGTIERIDCLCGTNEVYP